MITLRALWLIIVDCELNYLKKGVDMGEKTNRREFLKAVNLIGLAASGLALGMGSKAEAATLQYSPMTASGDRYINPRKVLLWECTRKEIREAFESGKLKAAIVPTGSTEQHNEHLAMIHDTVSATLISQLVALKMYPEVIVSTPVPFGFSPYWMNRKGTLTLRPEIFLGVVYDICESLKTHGIKTIFIVNGHGGNAKHLAGAMTEFRSKLGITIDSCSYWDGLTPDKVKSILESGDVPGHASELETSMGLAAFPERVHISEVNYDKANLSNLTEDERKADRDGYQKALLGTADKGEKIIALAVQWVAEKLQGMMG